MDRKEEAIKWADQVDVSDLDADEMSVSLAILANVYYESGHIESAYRFAKLAADHGDEDAKELLEVL